MSARRYDLSPVVMAVASLALARTLDGWLHTTWLVLAYAAWLVAVLGFVADFLGWCTARRDAADAKFARQHRCER